MAVDGDLQDNGVYTMTNLKAATGVADDRLSAHHPNGAGNTTSFGDFVCRGMGQLVDGGNAGLPGDWTTLLEPHLVNGGTSFSGDYDSSTPPVYSFDSTTLSATDSDTFVIPLRCGFAGEHFREVIGALSSNLSVSPGGVVTLLSRDVTATRNNVDFIDFQFEVTGYAPTMEIEWSWADGLNTGATLYNTPLFFRTDSVDAGTPRIAYDTKEIEHQDSENADGTHDFEINPNRAAVDVLYDPTNEVDVSQSSWELYAGGTLQGTTSGDPKFTITNRFEASGGENWKLELYDQNSTFVDAVVWTWGDANAPYDSGGDPATGIFGDRQSDSAAGGPSSPVTVLITSHSDPS